MPSSRDNNEKPCKLRCGRPRHYRHAVAFPAFGLRECDGEVSPHTKKDVTTNVLTANR